MKNNYCKNEFEFCAQTLYSACGNTAIENVVFIRKNRTFYNYRNKYTKFYVFLLYFDN